MALFAIFYACGATVGPVLGGWLYDKDGFDFTTCFIAIVAFSWFILYTFIVFICDCSSGK